MAIFILPTTGNTTYRGKYPTRARSVSSSRHMGRYVELNNGTRLWSIDDRSPEWLATMRGTDYASSLARAVKMTDAQYGELMASADVMCAHRNAADPEAERQRCRDMRLAIKPETANDTPAPAPTVRRDNVEYHAGRDAWSANATKDSNPYTAGGERAARWDLGWQEACDSAAPVLSGMVQILKADGDRWKLYAHGARHTRKAAAGAVALIERNGGAAMVIPCPANGEAR